MAVALLCCFLSPAAAEGGENDPSGPVIGIVCQSPDIYSINMEDSAGPIGTEIPIRATVTGCQNCYYTWTITPVNCPEMYYESHNTEFIHRFPGPGEYRIALTVWEQAVQCTGESPSALLTKTVRVSGDPLGAYGSCCQPGADNAVLTQDAETTDLSGSSQSGFFNYALWNCPGCTVNMLVKWSNPRTGEWDDIPLSSSNSGYPSDSSFRFTFPGPGIYGITAKIDNPAACSYDSQSRSSGYASVLHTATGSVNRGVGGTCAEPGAVTINQPLENSEAGSGSGSWTAVPDFSCADCVYTWSFWRITTDSWVPVTIDPARMIGQNTQSITYSFPEPGDYKINVKVENPPECPYTGSYRPYSSTTVIHRVSAPASVSPQTAPDIIPGITATTAPARSVSTTPVVTGTNPQSGEMAPAATTLFPRQTSTTAPSWAGIDDQVSGSVPVITTSAPAVSETAGTAAAPAPVPVTTTKRSPGFALAITLCAGLLIVVMRRK